MQKKRKKIRYSLECPYFFWVPNVGRRKQIGFLDNSTKESEVATLSALWYVYICPVQGLNSGINIPDSCWKEREEGRGRK